MRTAARTAAAALALAGVALLAWVGATLVWGEPMTGFMAKGEQAELRTELTRKEHTTAAALTKATILERGVAYRRALRDGDALGRIIVQRLGLNE